MAGTDNNACANCGDTGYDQPEMVGDLCPLCWEEQELERAVADAEAAAEKAKADLDQRRKDNKEARKAAKAEAKAK